MTSEMGMEFSRKMKNPITGFLEKIIEKAGEFLYTPMEGRFMETSVMMSLFLFK